MNFHLIYDIIYNNGVVVYIFFGIIIFLAIIIIVAGIYSVYKVKINFYITGLDSKFSLADLALLWKVSQICNLDNPTSLFYSLASLSKCMTMITSQAHAEGKDDDLKTQNLIGKLFEYRTKLQNESDEKKGLDSTINLDRNQKLRIILPGKGVFASEILNNGKELIVSVPRQKDLIPISAEDWVGKTINVYLWRKGDARYTFDTSVIGHGLFVGQSSISLKHTSNLLRTQKRKSVRAKCEIHAQLYIIKEAEIDYDAIETKNGYKCIIQDISESGALIKIGGKGVANVQIKLQFTIKTSLIVMFGVVRTAEYNEQTNQSLLHFECIHIEKTMKNTVLQYVYNMMSDSEKEVYDAITLTDQDEEEDKNITETTNNQLSNTIQDDITQNDASKELAKDPLRQEPEKTKDDVSKAVIGDPLLSDSEVDESITIFDDYQKQ